MFSICVLFFVCLSFWFALDHYAIEPAIRSAARRKHGKSVRGSPRREARVYQVYDSECITPRREDKALYDAFGERFFNYEKDR